MPITALCTMMMWQPTSDSTKCATTKICSGNLYSLLTPSHHAIYFWTSYWKLPAVYHTVVRTLASTVRTPCICADAGDGADGRNRDFFPLSLTCICYVPNWKLSEFEFGRQFCPSSFKFGLLYCAVFTHSSRIVRLTHAVWHNFFTAVLVVIFFHSYLIVRIGEFVFD